MNTDVNYLFILSLLFWFVLSLFNKSRCQSKRSINSAFSMNPPLVIYFILYLLPKLLSFNEKYGIVLKILNSLFYQDITTGNSTNTTLTVFTISSNYKYRFRMVNAFCTVCPAELRFEGHSMTLIATDGESVYPRVVDTLTSFAGEEISRADFSAILFSDFLFLYLSSILNLIPYQFLQMEITISAVTIWMAFRWTIRFYNTWEEKTRYVLDSSSCSRRMRR